MAHVTSSVLLPGHPLFFARALVHDPVVLTAAELYDRLAEQKDRLLHEQRFDEAWGTLLQLRGIEAGLRERCERLGKADQPPPDA